nr:hypothetical protein [Tanacetum cinerariifolium]
MLKFICQWADPFKDLKCSIVTGVKLYSLSKSDETFSSLHALSDLNYLFGGFMYYLWSRELNISNFSQSDRKILPVVPSGRTSNALSIPHKSASMFSSLIASVWASRICVGNFRCRVITNALTQSGLIRSFRLKASAMTFAFPGWELHIKGFHLVTYKSVPNSVEDYSDIGSPEVDAPLSPDYVPGPEEPEQAPLSTDYVPGPEEPKQAPPLPVYLPYPLPVADTPTADSPGYIPEFDPNGVLEEDEEEDPKEDPADYPANSTVVALPAVDHVPSEEVTEPLPQIPSPTLPIPSPPPDSPTHIEIFESCLPLWMRLRFATPTRSQEVGESSAAGAAGQNEPTIARDDPYSLVREELYGFFDRGITAALAARDANRNGDDSHTSGTDRPVQVARECTYPDFLKCQPLNFKGTEGVVGLSQWFEKTESVFSISNCTVACKVKFATCTLQGNALTWWNSHVKTTTPEAAHAMPWRTDVVFLYTYIISKLIRAKPLSIFSNRVERLRIC